MSILNETIAKHYNWSIDYTNQVIYEYERFMYLKANFIDILQSEDIDKLWKYHILLPENYYNYCISKFGKIINYNQIEILENNYCKISNTLTYYKNTFGEITYKDVWMFNLKLNIEQIVYSFVSTSENTVFPFLRSSKSTVNLLKESGYKELFSGIQTKENTQNEQSYIINNDYPSYIQNKPELATIKLYFTYNKQFITYKPTSISETIETLKILISKEINIDKKNIILKLHPDINIIGFDKVAHLSNEIIKDSSFLSTLINKNYNFIIVELTN